MVKSNSENWNDMEQIEVWNTTTGKKQEGFDFRWPINDFIEKSINWNILYFKWKKKEDIFKEFLSFFVSSWVRPDLSTYFLKTIKKVNSWILDNFEKEIYDKLFFEINQETIPLESLYNLVLKLFDKTYVFTDEEKSKLEKALQKEWKWDLDYLTVSTIRRKKFLQKHKILSRYKIDKNEDEMLEDIFWNLDENLKNDKEFIQSLSKFYNGNYLVEITDLKNILDKLENKDKLSLIKYFVPKISLKDARQYWFLNDDEIREIILKELENLDLTEEQQQRFLQICDYGDFFIETWKLWENILDVRILNHFLQKAVTEYKKSITVSKTWLEFYDINDFINQALQAWIIPTSFKEAFLKFWVWSYMEISKNIAWWKKTYYFRVDEINDSVEDESLYFKITNVTNPTGWIIKNDKWVNTDKISFEDLFEKIANINSSSWINEIAFYSSKDELKTQSKVEENIFLWNIESWDIETPEELKKVLDEIDKDWKDISLENMAFRCAPKWESKNLLWKYLIEDEVYVVEKIQNWQVFLRWQWAMSFTDFALAFKDRECKRFKKLDTLADFFQELKNHENLKEWLKDFELKDGKILPKSNNHGEKLEYLVAQDGEALMIEKLDFSSMDFVTGEYKEASKEWESNIFDASKWWKWKWFDYNTVFLYLTSKKFSPVYNKEVEKEHHKHDEEHLHKHSSIFKSYLSCLSIKEMISWWSHVLHTIEHRLKFWNDLKAAKFARMLWKFLPEWIQYEIEAHVEQEESKLMEAKIKELKWMNTIKMIKEVEHILASAKPYDFELEAALLAVVWKTWVLYPKGLKKYKWQFLWYEALWWKVWDAMYMKFKKECDESGKDWWKPTPFTEEYLVEKLLDYQTDTLNKRRNKFNKQYWNVLKDWKKEEEEDWERKTRNKTTLYWRLNYILDEFENLTYWNWIGWIENLIAKWPDPWYLFWAIPFIMLTSWMTKDFVPEMSWTMFWHAFTNPVFWPLFLQSVPDNLKIYNDYVAKVIELWKWKDSDVLKEFRDISHGTRPQNIKKARDFWLKYGKELYPKINMSDGFVLSKKDEFEELKAYYEKIKVLHSTDDFKNGFKEDLVKLWFVDQGNSPIAATWWLLSKIKIDFSWKFDTTSKKLVIMYLEQFLQVIKDNSISEEKRKELFKYYYTMIERQLSNEIKWATKWIGSDYKNLAFYTDVREITYPYNFELYPWRYDLYNKEWEADSIEYNKMLDKKWEEFISWKKIGNWVQEEVWEVKNSIFDVLK